MFNRNVDDGVLGGPVSTSEYWFSTVPINPSISQIDGQISSAKYPKKHLIFLLSAAENLPTRLTGRLPEWRAYE